MQFSLRSVFLFIVIFGILGAPVYYVGPEWAVLGDVYGVELLVGIAIACGHSVSTGKRDLAFVLALLAVILAAGFL
jgi:hypothetical protein